MLIFYYNVLGTIFVGFFLLTSTALICISLGPHLYHVLPGLGDDQSAGLVPVSPHSVLGHIFLVFFSPVHSFCLSHSNSPLPRSIFSPSSPLAWGHFGVTLICEFPLWTNSPGTLLSGIVGRYV